MMVHCGFKEMRIMSFSLVTAQFFSFRLLGGGGPCSQRALGFKRAAMVAVGWNSEKVAFASTTGQN